MLTKQTPEYVDINAVFQPLPKYGHLSEKTPEYAAAESAIDAVYSQLWDLPDLPAIREAAGDADAPMPPGGPVRGRDVVTDLITFHARDGFEIEFKVYKSHNVNTNATLMYRMHGGGWVVGRHEVDGTENVYAAANPNIVVVSVDYRKAPEHPFPQPFYDCYDGLIWCKENAKFLGVDPEKIILSGSSAGANLAAALAIEARDKGITGITAQVLHFPSLCHPEFFPRDKFEYGSYIQNKDNPVLDLLKMEFFFDSYLPNRKSDYRHSPLLTPSLEGLPSTLIQCAGVDVLRDDAFAYAEALENDGVDVKIRCYQGVPHCFPAILSAADETSEFYKTYNEFIEEHTGC